MATEVTGNNKAIAAGLSGSIVIIVAWVSLTFLHTEIPIDVVAAIQTVFTTAAVWLVPHGGNS